jgi:hypothetical protein
MDYSSIEKFVGDRYSRVSETDLHDIVAEASLFLDEHGLTGIEEGIEQGLSAHLAEYHKQVQSSKAGRDTTRNWREQPFSEIPDPFGNPISDDERISAIAHAPIFDISREVKAEVEESLAEFERKRESLQSLLPLAVFEALERRLIPDTPPRWTTGFERSGLLILLRRARIRMEWEE